MKKVNIIVLLVFVLLLLSQLFAENLQGENSESIQLKYISPNELIQSLGLSNQSSKGYVLSLSNSDIYLRFNQFNNQLLLCGNKSNIVEAKELISFMDVPPRQIVVEVKIIEIDDSKVRETGIDWQTLLDELRLGISFNSADIESDKKTDTGDDNGTSFNDINQTQNQYNFSASLGSIYLGEILKIIQENNIGTITNAPRIVTTNNRTGKLIDGERITYVSRYSSYSNLFETQEISTGLSLEVTPSIGESGYLKMDVIAKLTTLGTVISGSPSESGQILENTVILKDKESFLLGEFKQVENRKIKRKVPVLGSILPFIFSRDVNVASTKNILIVLTPEIIDLNPVNIPEIK